MTMPIEGTVEIESAQSGNAIITFVPLAGSATFNITSADILIKKLN